MKKRPLLISFPPFTTVNFASALVTAEICATLYIAHMAQVAEGVHQTVFIFAN